MEFVCDSTCETKCEATSPKNFSPKLFHIARCDDLTLCNESLEIFNLTRSHIHINHLVPEVLLNIFGNLPADFLLETLRLVCSMWREIIDRTFTSVNSIECSYFGFGPAKFTLSFSGSSANFTGTCSTGKLRFYLQKCSLKLKKLHFTNLSISQTLQESLFWAVENCRNLTELWLHCPLSSDLFSRMDLPELHTLTLKSPSLGFGFRNKKFFTLPHFSSIFASCLAKHGKIANLCFDGSNLCRPVNPVVAMLFYGRLFTPGIDPYVALGNLKLENFSYVENSRLEDTSVGPLFECLKLSSNSLHSLSLTGSFDGALHQEPFLSLIREFRMSQQLRSLRLHCTQPLNSQISPESTFLGLKGLLSLNILHLEGFDFKFEPQNWRRLTAGHLLAPVLQNLTDLTLDGIFDGRFFGHAFSSGLTKLKKLFVSEWSELNVENLLNHWCPSLEELGSYPQSVDIDFFTNFHRIVHSCRLNKTSSLGMLPKRQLFVKGFYLPAEKREKFKLCSVKFVNGGISISRTHCC